MHRAVGLMALLVVAGCDESASTEDSGAARDGGVVRRDGGSSGDSGPQDAGSPVADAGPPSDAGLPSERHVARSIGYMDSPRGFWEYLPPSYSASGTGSPLLLFFHGLGENGNGMTGAGGTLGNAALHGPPLYINRDEWPADRPFIVLSSQQLSGCPNANQVDEFLDWALAHYNVDPDRIYLTGLSCGGIGTAAYLSTHVDTTDVAAVVMISGNMNSLWSAQGCDLGRVAVWGIHGDADSNGGTPPNSTQGPMEMLIACPSPPRRDARLNMLAGIDHESRAWDDTYSGANGLDIYTWMLDNHR